jgi:thiol-disulfide isomerase/thioredoxin
MIEELNDIVELIAEAVGSSEKAPKQIKFLSKTAVAHTLISDVGLMLGKFDMEETKGFNDKFDKICGLCDEMIPVLRELKKELRGILELKEKEFEKKEEENDEPKDSLGLRFLGK